MLRPFNEGSFEKRSPDQTFVTFNNYISIEIIPIKIYIIQKYMLSKGNTRPKIGIL
ncbi:hypothetical protein GCM10023331_25490 [Algivirga pacifica]|uniref:Uncharacterized protein n=1 Tax=Algivirga pacifica TaxID=1162670 RepID=A0ABP9DCA7_9BACT